MKKKKNLVWVTSDSSDVWLLCCRCPAFLKANGCKHVVGVAYVRNLLPVTETAETVNIRYSRKRGRPATARLTLQRQ